MKRAFLAALPLVLLLSVQASAKEAGDQYDLLPLAQEGLAHIPASAVRSGRGTTACLPSVVRSQAMVLVQSYGGTISSTHRPGARVAGTGHRSKHADCRAADVHVPPGQRAAAFRYLQSHRIGGLGRYAWGFHIDDGSVRAWSGGRSRHAKRGKRHRYAVAR